MKKISLIVLSFITIICCLCACGNSSSQSTNNQPSTSNKTTASDVSENGSKSSQGDTVVVPNVVGKDVAEATKELEGLGLKVETTKSHYEKNPTTQDFYPDNYVIQQDIQQGTVMTNGSKISLTVNTNTDEWVYKVNEDKTITLISCAISRTPNNILRVPAKYDGHIVSRISADFILRQSAFSIIVSIPSGVQIEGEITTDNYEYYS